MLSSFAGMFFVLEIPISKNMKVAYLLKLLKKHPLKRGLVTVPGKPADEIKKGTLGSILRQANIKQT